jgi:hypothetical protein
MSLSALQASEIRKLAKEELIRRGALSSRVDYEREPRIKHGTELLPLHAGQLQAWSSIKRIVAIFAGWQSGKTVIGPHWLAREMQRRGPGDYAVIAPNYPLLDNKARPELIRVFGGMVRTSGNELHVTEIGCEMLGWPKGGTGRILLRHAERAEAIEAFTALAIWVDEPGQIADEVWESIQARASTTGGRFLLTSRPYEHNWYVNDIWHKRGGRDDIEIVNYRSIDNPSFPAEEYELQKLLLPEWKFTMKYDGIPTRPAGLVYDCWDSDRILDGGGRVPSSWARYVGVDFGPDNTCAVFLAAERDMLPSGEWGGDTGRYVLYAAWHGGRKTPAEYAAFWRELAPMVEDSRGGSAQEVSWRGWFSEHWPIGEPKHSGPGSVDVGIQHVYRLVKEKRLFVTRDAQSVIDEFERYSYELDDNGEPTEKLAKDKHSFHRLDALRYIAPSLIPNRQRGYGSENAGGYALR